MIALVAAGMAAEDAINEVLGADGLTDDILSALGAGVFVGATRGVIESTVDVGMDVVDAFNPFK
jgi:hypothetical protein